MTTLVLVHGAFRGAWTWAPTVASLARRGVAAVAPDLPGCGDRHAADADPVHLADVAADLAAFADDVGDDVVLVGHSQGALVVAASLAAPPRRLVGVAHLDGAVPEAGQRACDLLGVAPPAADLVVVPPPPDPLLAVHLRALVADRARPQHATMAGDPLPAPAVEVPTAWAFCRGTPPGYPCEAVRARLDAQGARYDWLDAPHDAPLAAPEAVAAWLAGVLGSMPGALTPRRATS
jgi:pimeloyl-ACP methyl ester carboxylesterase